MNIYYFLLTKEDLDPLEIRYFDLPTIQRGIYRDGDDPSGVPFEWKEEELWVRLGDIVGESNIYVLKYAGFNMWDIWVRGDESYVKMILYFPTSHRSTIIPS